MQFKKEAIQQSTEALVQGSRPSVSGGIYFCLVTFRGDFPRSQIMHFDQIDPGLGWGSKHVD